MELLLALIAIWALGLWGLYCIRKAGRQRLRLLDLMFGRPGWRDLLRQFDSVSFDAHILSIATFRDPMRLYPAPLREIWK